jgi:hypothetical protein
MTFHSRKIQNVPRNQNLDDFPSVALLKYYHRLLRERAIRLGFADGDLPSKANSDFDVAFLLDDALPLLSDILAHEPLASTPLELTRAEADLIARLLTERCPDLM